MKKVTRGIAVVLAAIMTVTGVKTVPVKADTQAKSVDIMFTSDLHSHVNSFNTILAGETEAKNVGGFARIETLIKEQKEENPETLLLDGGDFSMGTLIQTV